MFFLKETILSAISKNKHKLFLINGILSYSYEELLNMLIVINDILYFNQYKRVLICLPQGFYAYSMILASYFTNSTFCIINTDIPTERKELIIRDFQPDVVAIAKDECINFKEIPVIRLDDVRWELDKYDIEKYKLSCFENETIYVSFTSGSTGEPKGCRIKRSAVERIVLWAVEEFGLNNDTVWGQYTPIYFDMSLIDIFGATCLGATLISFSDIYDKLRPGNIIKKHGINFLNIVPQVIDILFKCKQFNEEFCKSLSTIRFGGEKVYRVMLDRIFEILPNVRIISTYGPTETTFFCTSIKVNKSNYNKFTSDTASIGMPVPGIGIELVDVIDGIGEIVISGDNVGFGYIGKEQLGYKTQLLDDKHHVIYHTGDYAKFVDGKYYFCGRKDSQIKINGQRFNLIEIENALKKAGCDECAAVHINNDIICYYVDHRQVLNQEYLDSILKTSIPAIFLPKCYIKIKRMIYNPNGKIDRIQLLKIMEENDYEL